jgi:hypothetical protein
MRLASRRPTSPTSEHRRPRPLASERAAAPLALLACLLLAPPAFAAFPAHPRLLEYRIAWNGIPAAGASVAITAGEVAGQDSIVVEATARTNAFVDLFWPFRGTVRATFLRDGLTPRHFVYDRQMNGTPYLTSVDFDQERARSVYIRGSRRRESALDEAGVIDPITAVFRARLSGAKPGDTLRYEVWTGEARYRVELAVNGPESIDVPAGRFSALRVVPTVWKVGSQPERDTRLRQATIWVADDPARTLLRIRSEIFIGAVTLDLVRVEADTHAAASAPQPAGQEAIHTG